MDFIFLVQLTIKSKNSGHSFQKPEHYKKMDKEYEDGYLILSGFSPKGYTPRYTVRKERNKIN